MKTRVILYIAISQDGFIADKEGSVRFLDKYQDSAQDCGYQNFYASIDALVFGKNTYTQVLTFGQWPYPGKKSYIFADMDTKSANDDVEIITTHIPPFMKKIESLSTKRLWLMGGAQLVDSFYKLELIDEYIFTILPDILQEGIALPEPIFKEQNLTLMSIKEYPSIGAVEKRYENIKTDN